MSKGGVLFQDPFPLIYSVHWDFTPNFVICLHYILPLTISSCPAPGATAASGENSDKGEFSHLCGTSQRLPGNGSGHQCDTGQSHSWGCHR